VSDKDKTLDTLRLKNLAGDLLRAKSYEESARESRIAIEGQIIALVDFDSDRGQKTVTLEDGTKIVVKKELSYKVNFEALEEERFPLDEDGEQPPMPTKLKTTRELDVKGYEWYRENNPDVFRIIAQHVTVTPRKPSVEVKVKS
jgi:hypothetical protein